MKKKPELLIFDWDGTLMDSISVITTSLIDSFHELDFSPLTREKASSIIGLGLIDALEVLTPGKSQKEREMLLQTYKKHFLEKSASGMSFFPGMEEAVNKIPEKGILMAVATGKSREGLERDFSRTGNKHLFGTSRTVTECKPKPDPEMIIQILEELSVNPEDAVMIGDTTFDLEMASKAGIASVAVSYGAHPVEDLNRFPAIERFDSTTQVIDWLESL